MEFLKIFNFLDFKNNIFLFLIIFIMIIAIIFFLRKIFIKKIFRKLYQNKNKQYHLIFVSHFLKYLFFYLVLLCIALFFRYFNIFFNKKIIIEEFLIVIFIASLIFPLFKISDLFLENIFKVTHNKIISLSIIKTILKIVIILLILIIILSILKISITPLLATLGIGGVTIAFALKNFFANFFSGFNLLFSDQIRIDDYIELENGDKGIVLDINWRFTKVKIFGNSIIFIPNMKLQDTIVKNHSLPNLETDIKIDFQVHYSSDLDFVEKIVIDVANQILKDSEFCVKNFEPFVRFSEFDESGINISVFLRAKDYASQFIIKHEFIKLIHNRFKTEKIIIPYKIIAINTNQEK
jgi:small-conductance mechanosensitive channel